jgi:murein DD-endopeptidase MepM/ murein hydrolase activator NlpD
MILLVSTVSAVGPQTRRGHRRTKSAKSGNLKGRLGQIARQKQAMQAQLHATRVKAKVVQHDLHTINVRLADVQERLQETKHDLGSARQQQAQVTADLEKTTEELGRVRTQAKLRLRAMAKQGNANLLVAFVGSKSVSDLAERKDLMERIAHRDHQLFERVKTLQTQVAARKKQKDSLVVQVSSLVRRQSNQQNELAVVQAEKGEALQGLKQEARELEGQLRQIEQDERQVRRLIELAARRARMHHTTVPKFAGTYMRPVDAPITSGFGMRFHPILHYSRPHNGIDFGARYGTPVRCAAPGRVIAATTMRGFGNVVIVDHGGGVTTVYAHLSHISVRSGQSLTQGQNLGNVGKSGLATGPHLHFEMHIDGVPVDPRARL